MNIDAIDAMTAIRDFENGRLVSEDEAEALRDAGEYQMVLVLALLACKVLRHDPADGLALDGLEWARAKLQDEIAGSDDQG